MEDLVQWWIKLQQPAPFGLGLRAHFHWHGDKLCDHTAVPSFFRVTSFVFLVTGDSILQLFAVECTILTVRDFERISLAGSIAKATPNRACGHNVSSSTV